MTDKEHKTIVMAGAAVLNMYKECTTGKFQEYPTGTRVRRGYDWSHGDQDSHGVGTIIGHDDEHSYSTYVRVWVEWDSGRKHNYVIKSLSITNEDRIPPENETIAVGSTVRPGKDFKRQTTDKEERNETGVVIRVEFTLRKAMVRWKYGACDWYHFGMLGTPQEIEPVRVPALRIGCVDGIHVRIQKTAAADGRQFLNRKHIASISVMCVCGHKEPPFDFSDHHLSERDLQMIADKIGKNWRLLGAELGLSEVMLDHVDEDKPTSVHRIATMLNKWKTATGEQATLQNLLTILRRNAGVVNIAWDEMEKILFSGQVPQWYKTMITTTS